MGTTPMKPGSSIPMDEDELRTMENGDEDSDGSIVEVVAAPRESARSSAHHDGDEKDTAEARFNESQTNEEEEATSKKQAGCSSERKKRPSIAPVRTPRSRGAKREEVKNPSTSSSKKQRKSKDGSKDGDKEPSPRQSKGDRMSISPADGEITRKEETACQFHLIQPHGDSCIRTTRVWNSVHVAGGTPLSFQCPVCFQGQLESVDGLSKHLKEKHSDDYDCHRFYVEGEHRAVILMFHTPTLSSPKEVTQEPLGLPIIVPPFPSKVTYVRMATMEPMCATEWYMQWLPYNVKRQHNVMPDEHWLHQADDSALCDLLDVTESEKRFMLLWNDFRRKSSQRGSQGCLLPVLHEFIEKHAKSIELESFQSHCLELWRSGFIGREQILDCVEMLISKLQQGHKKVATSS